MFLYVAACGKVLKWRALPIYIRHLKDLQALTENDIIAMDHGGQPTRRLRR